MAWSEDFFFFFFLEIEKKKSRQAFSRVGRVTANKQFFLCLTTKEAAVTAVNSVMISMVYQSNKVIITVFLMCVEIHQCLYVS